MLVFLGQIVLYIIFMVNIKEVNLYGSNTRRWRSNTRVEVKHQTTDTEMKSKGCRRRSCYKRTTEANDNMATNSRKEAAQINDRLNDISKS
jgi:hypothetical protein